MTIRPYKIFAIIALTTCLCHIACGEYNTFSTSRNLHVENLIFYSSDQGTFQRQTDLVLWAQEKDFWQTTSTPTINLGFLHPQGKKSLFRTTKEGHKRCVHIPCSQMYRDSDQSSPKPVVPTECPIFRPSFLSGLDHESMLKKEHTTDTKKKKNPGFLLELLYRSQFLSLKITNEREREPPETSILDDQRQPGRKL